MLKILRCEKTGAAGNIGWGWKRSFSFFARNWSQWFDIIPIVIFVFYYLNVAASKVMGLSFGGVLLVNSILIVSSYLFAVFIGAEVTNGSNQYFGVLFTLFCLGLLDWKLAKSKIILHSGVLFAVSLLFRSFDSSRIYNPYGLHFVWHLLNGLLLSTSLAFG